MVWIRIPIWFDQRFGREKCTRVGCFDSVVISQNKKGKSFLNRFDKCCHFSSSGLLASVIPILPYIQVGTPLQILLIVNILHVTERYVGFEKLNLVFRYTETLYIMRK